MGSKTLMVSMCSFGLNFGLIGSEIGRIDLKFWSGIGLSLAPPGLK